MITSKLQTSTIKFQRHFIEEYVKSYLDEISPIFYLDSEEALQICWDKFTLKCISEANHLDKTKVIHNLSQLNNLIPILLERAFHVFESILQKFYLKKNFCTTLQHRPWYVCSFLFNIIKNLLFLKEIFFLI
ncbi:hypothetical protein MXB_5283 [Myxobolus squamalis]|nr:hypothetical protein MXB_5283 [Myxobolus squamalis]